MCASCGCHLWNNDHGDARHITLDELDAAADAAGISRTEAYLNIGESVGVQKYAYLALLTEPHVPYLAAFKRFGDPNSTQTRDDHGRFTAGNLAPTGRNWDQMSAAEQQTALSKLADKGVNTDKVLQNMRDALDKADPKDAQWYQDQHDKITALADKYGIDRDHAYALTAALSPQCEWNRNLVAAETVMEKVSSGQTTPDDMKEISAHCAVLGPGVSKAFALAQGADIDKTLGGAKVRSFYTNLALPEGRPDVATLDNHQGMLMLRGMQPGSANNGYSDVNKNYISRVYNTSVGGTKAGYAVMSHLVQEVAQERHLTTNGAQAEMWTTWLRDHPPSPFMQHLQTSLLANASTYRDSLGARAAA